MNRLRISEVKELTRKALRIQDLDDEVKNLFEMLADPRGPDAVLGEKIRSFIGQTKFTHFTNQSVSAIVLASLLNALLARRAKLAEEIGELIEVPAPPCPPYKLSLELLK